MAETKALAARLAWLRAKPYFAVLSGDDLAFIAERIIARNYRKGEQIVVTLPANTLRGKT